MRTRSRWAAGCSSTRACPATAGARARRATIRHKRSPTASPRSLGRALLDRNAIALANLRLNRWFGWAGAADSLWAQSIRPILDEKELGLTAGAAARAAGIATRRWRPPTRACSAPPSADDAAERVLVNVAKALAAFQETIVTGRTPFDDFRDALERGDRAAHGPLSARRAARPAASSSARAAAAPATSARTSPTASSRTSASASSPRRAASTRAGTAASPHCGRAPSTCWAVTTTIADKRHRRADAPRRAAAPQLGRVPRAVAAQRRAHRALHAQRQPRDAGRRRAPLFGARRGAPARPRRQTPASARCGSRPKRRPTWWPSSRRCRPASRHTSSRAACRQGHDASHRRLSLASGTGPVAELADHVAARNGVERRTFHDALGGEVGCAVCRCRNSSCGACRRLAPA